MCLLALVQPILALELLFVFGYLAVVGSRRVKVKRRDWLAAAAMSAGLGLFLFLASPSGGRLHAAGSSWWLAGLVTFGVVLLALAVALGPGNGPGASRARRAAVLGAVTGISWGHREQLRKLTLEYQPADAPQGPVGNRPRNPATRSPQL